jgi:hypothetical protein
MSAFCKFKWTDQAAGMAACEYCWRPARLRRLDTVRKCRSANAIADAPPTTKSKPDCRSCGGKAAALPAWQLAAEWLVHLDLLAIAEPGDYQLWRPLAIDAHEELESRGVYHTFSDGAKYQFMELVFERRRDGREKCALQFCSPAPKALCGPRFTSGWLPAGAFAARQELRDQAGELPPIVVEPAG